MKTFDWNAEKNQKLSLERGISFEDVVFYLQNGYILDDIDHPNQEKYSGQRVYIVNVDNYAYLIPYIEDDDKVFLKTIIPNRKATKMYLGGEDEK